MPKLPPPAPLPHARHALATHVSTPQGLRQLMLTLLLGLGVLALPMAADAGKKKSVRSAATAKAPGSQGSAETRAERDRRLSRECRGRPNAGACQGYTR